MDPNANLEEQRRIAAQLVEMIEGDREFHPSALEDRAHRLGELVIALDNWLTPGNFLPRAWWTSGVTFAEEGDKPPGCLRCRENEARYLSGLCGLCDMKAGTGAKLLRDASINDLRVARWAMGNAIKGALGMTDD